jgi:O-antigen ligase
VFRITILIAVVGIPLAILPGIFLRYFTTPKVVLLYVSVAALLLSVDAWWPGLTDLAATAWGRVFCAALIAEIASLFVSAAWSAQPSLALAGASATRLGALTQICIVIAAAALAGYVYRNRGFGRDVLRWMELCAGVAAVYVIAQYLGWDPLLSRELYTEPVALSFVRPPATFGQATYCAAFLLPGTFIAAGAIESARARRRWMHTGVFCCCIVAILLTGTRSALLGLAGGGVLLVWTRARFIGAKPILKFLVATAAAASVVIALLTLSPVGQSFRRRVSQWVEDAAGGTRLLVWRDSIQLIRDHPIGGIGPERFAGEFRRIQSVELSRKYPDRYHEDPHNILLGVTVAQGAAGVAVLLCLISSGIVCGLGSARKGSSRAAVLASGLAALILTLQFTPLTVPTELYLLLLVALLVALGTGPDAKEVSGRTSVGIKILAGTAAALAAACVVLFAVDDAAVASIDRSVAQGDLDEVRRSYRLVQRLALPSDDLWCSKQIVAMARVLKSPQRESAMALAQEASARAEQYSEVRFDALLQSALLNILMNEDHQAEAKLRSGIAAAPAWYRPHLLLASFLLANGNAIEAERESNLAVTLAGKNEPDVRFALNRSKRSTK